MKPYNQSIEDLVKQFSTHLSRGLMPDEVRKRLALHGPNSLPEKSQESWAIIFLRQFKSPLIYILLAAAAIMFVIAPGKPDAFIISGILFFNALVGAVQEGRAQSMLEGLRHYIKTTTMVIRGGEKIVVDDADLVVGDIILVYEGGRVPADARIISAQNLCVDESILTGESEMVHKIIETLEGVKPLYEQKNMLFKGTYITMGNAQALVVATGADTQVGHIQSVIQDIDTQMPIKKEIDRLAHFVLLLILGICAALFVIGLVMGKPIKDLFIILTALFICVVPEGLPVVLTLILVTGAYRMAGRRVLIKRMQAIEALGRADVIMIDKTGTLTRNEMMVAHVIAQGRCFDLSGMGYFEAGELLLDGRPVGANNHPALILMAQAAALLDRSEIMHNATTNLFDIKGDPTEVAMAIFAHKVGIDKKNLEIDFELLYEIPFDARWKFHAAFYKHHDKGVVFLIGSPEVLMQKAIKVDSVDHQLSQQLLAQGLRLVAVASKEFDYTKVPVRDLQDWYSTLLVDFALLGFFGITDTLRPEVSEVVKQARNNGLHVIMATGDHQKTAFFIAGATGIFQEGDSALDGAELALLSDDALLQKLDSITVYSRLAPEQKLHIITLLRSQGHLVAMTGDGVNDVPALVAADLGIAMGGIGTEVAKQAADIILLDDSFANIISAIEQGRHIFYTLRRVITCFFATNLGEVLVVLFALALGLPLPITAAQILWLNLIADGFLDVALSMEPQEKDLLTHRGFRNVRLIDPALVAKTLFMALPMGVGALYIFLRYYQENLVYAQSATLITMAMLQVFNTWNCRSETKSIVTLGLFANRWLVLATLGIGCLQLALLYVPFLQKIFGTVPLEFHDWIIIIMLASSVIVLEEMRKFFMRWYRA